MDVPYVSICRIVCYLRNHWGLGNGSTMSPVRLHMGMVMAWSRTCRSKPRSLRNSNIFNRAVNRGRPYIHTVVYNTKEGYFLTYFTKKLEPKKKTTTSVQLRLIGLPENFLHQTLVGTDFAWRGKAQSTPNLSRRAW